MNKLGWTGQFQYTSYLNAKLLLFALLWRTLMRTLTLSAMLLIALPTFATPDLNFEEVDTDGDGLISTDEADSVEGINFSAADTDHDGTITVDEYEVAIDDSTSLPVGEEQINNNEADKEENSPTSSNNSTVLTQGTTPVMNTR
jgi:hypothetical protein